MRFDIEQYTGDYAMSCENEREAQIFCNYLHSVGRTWCDGDEYTKTTVFERYGQDTCYAFNDGKIGAYDFYEDDDERDWTILSFSDFDWSDYKPKPLTDTKSMNNFISQFALN